MPEVDYVVLSEWFDWIVRNINVSVDLIGEMPLLPPPGPPSPGPSEEELARVTNQQGRLAGPLPLVVLSPHQFSPFPKGRLNLGAPGPSWRSTLAFVPHAVPLSSS